MSGAHLLYSYAITKMTKGQRKALLAGVDAGGRLPDGVVSARVLGSIPEAWARTDEETGSRFLTPEGRAALIPIDRYRHLRRANPETGAVYGLSHYDGQGLSRDGLVIFQNCDGRIAEAADHWRTDAYPYITTRGRKLVGMPLTAPTSAARLPYRSRAVWRREGRPDELVQVNSWPFSDGMVIVHPLQTNGLDYRETEAPAAELHPS
ncbi:hypothetical protein [Streptomyces cahuitamycinicus]|uniref:Uncharacterized protein n=1 Tax=Streptomyces cahuitamycinicus TaxID=2070367 RepID=A0A2N8TCB7_9ACTN|nr:hypothetical protein [Streptomyces cahuitamycinicus]PNG16677.1 hypothetical protein C1J00_40620 [Streptomyces cahuitamycinicus]